MKHRNQGQILLDLHLKKLFHSGGPIVDGIILKYSVTVYLLVVNENRIDFCILTLYPEILLNSQKLLHML